MGIAIQRSHLADLWINTPPQHSGNKKSSKSCSAPGGTIVTWWFGHLLYHLHKASHRSLRPSFWEHTAYYKKDVNRRSIYKSKRRSSLYWGWLTYVLPTLRDSAWKLASRIDTYVYMWLFRAFLNVASTHYKTESKVNERKIPSAPANKFNSSILQLPVAPPALLDSPDFSTYNNYLRLYIYLFNSHQPVYRHRLRPSSSKVSYALEVPGYRMHVCLIKLQSTTFDPFSHTSSWIVLPGQLPPYTLYIRSHIFRFQF